MRMAGWFLKRHLTSTNASSVASGVPRAKLDGVLEGPIDDQAVMDGLKNGRFTMLDFAYSVEDGTWKSLAEIDIFRASVSAPELGRPSGDWTLMRRLGENENSAGILDGPFSTEAVLRLIASGEISFSDQICHRAESTWTRIGDRTEFDRGRRNAHALAALERPSSERVSERPVEEERELLKRINSYSGETLLQNVLQLRPTRPCAAPLAQEIIAESQSYESAALIEETDGLDLVALEDAARGFYIQVASKILGSLLGVLLVGSSLAFAQPATTLEIIPLKLSTPAGAVLVFQTDAPTNEPIQVKLSAKSGEILERNGYLKSFEVKREPSELASLSIGNLNLPVGQYTVQAKIESVTKVSAIFIGTKDDHFTSELAAHQKQIASRQQDEKKALYYSSVEFESLAKGLRGNYGKFRNRQAQWKAFFASWKIKARKARAKLWAFNDDSMAYPEEVAEFKAAADKLNDEANSLDAAIQQKREIASDSTSTLGHEFAGFRKLASHLSGQPEN